MAILLMGACATGCEGAAKSGHAASGTTTAQGSSTSTGGASSSASLAATGSGVSTGASGGSGLDYCQACDPPVSPGKVGSIINEASGLAASRIHPGRYYVHNDSGDSARFFAIDEKGQDFGRYNVEGAQAVDWEDMAVGPCPTGSCLFLGDVGDNPESRESYAVYRVAEPASLTAGEHTVSAEALPFRYPDGSHNCESLLVHPKSGDIFVITKKGSGPSALYVFPEQTPGKEVVLQKVLNLEPPKGDNRFTAGDIHPQGAGILMRTYTSLFFYAMDPTVTPQKSVADALTNAPCQVPASLEIQGESVAWLADGQGWLTLSEGTERPVIKVSCR